MTKIHPFPRPPAPPPTVAQILRDTPLTWVSVPIWRCAHCGAEAPERARVLHYAGCPKGDTP
jgi:hypothetical protein